MKKQRPVNLDLGTIRFPVTAIASILHRVTGVAAFIGIGILLWWLHLSLSSVEGFNSAASMAQHPFAKFIFWGIFSVLAYHLIVGVRHLLMDLGYFEELQSGNASAKVAFVISGILIILAGVWFIC